MLVCAGRSREEVPTRSTYCPGETTHSPSVLLHVEKLDASRAILTRFRLPGPEGERHLLASGHLREKRVRPVDGARAGSPERRRRRVHETGEHERGGGR